MPKREFLMLAHEYSDEPVGGWWASEKLDGQRAFWDGGISRGLPASQVPYANTAKDLRLTTPPVATGLWSRYGKVIHAPGWWLDGLPKQPVDLELWCGRGQFQLLRTIAGSHDPGETMADRGPWTHVRGHVLDAPTLGQVMAPGTIYNANWSAEFGPAMLAWCAQRDPALAARRPQPFKDAHAELRMLELKGWAPHLKVHDQRQLPQDGYEAADEVRRMLVEVTRQGGEGLVLRRPGAFWEPKRAKHALKVKPEHDAEGIVSGFTWGRETDKGSRHLGRMGALVLRLEPGVPKGAPNVVRRLELSGFTDAERAVVPAKGIGGNYADNGLPAESLVAPGEDATVFWEAASFPRGTKVTFTYRELSRDGIPKEARYLRKREGE